VQAPHWMFSHYLIAQQKQLWDVAGSVPQSIVAHTVFCLTPAAKQLVLKMYRWWQWPWLPSATTRPSFSNTPDVPPGAAQTLAFYLDSPFLLLPD
jgi:hypothetical protein